jgi:hypothetical protein
MTRLIEMIESARKTLAAFERESQIIEANVDQWVREKKHLSRFASGRQYEIEVECVCGNKDTIGFTRPKCSGGCERLMIPIGVLTFEEACGQKFYSK